MKHIQTNCSNLDNNVCRALDRQEKGWTKDYGVVSWRGHIHIPRDRSWHRKLIWLNHDSITAGYLRRYKTQELITRNYWWPNVAQNV